MILQLLLMIFGANFSHVCRNENKHAHLLAKHTLSIIDYCAWNEESPCFIKQALIHNVSMTFSN